MIKDKYLWMVSASTLCATLALLASLFCAGTGKDLWMVYAIAALLASVLWLVMALALSALRDRKPMLPFNSYAALKRRTARKIRKEYRLSRMTDRKMEEFRDDFIYEAVMLGMTRYTAEMDWVLEIQWRVKR